MNEADRENIGFLLRVACAMVLFACLGFLGMTWVLADHAPKSYYLDYNSASTMPYCIKASIPWDDDSYAFCSADPATTIQGWTILSSQGTTKVTIHSGDAQ